MEATIQVVHCEYENVPTFTDYRGDGYDISLIGALDFTYSNGLQNNPNSLHHISDKNQYIQAINSVGKILDQYDSDKVYPIYGFGGAPTYMGSNEVSHCFPLNGQKNNPEIAGIENVIKTYKENSGKVKLLGPTLFAPVLRQTRDLINKEQNKKMYYILLVLTDGEIHDMEETMAEIAGFSDENLPVSIIIVGIGSENFSNMVKLDGDDV